jgi:hypothetical protein
MADNNIKNKKNKGLFYNLRKHNCPPAVLSFVPGRDNDFSALLNFLII